MPVEEKTKKISRRGCVVPEFLFNDTQVVEGGKTVIFLNDFLFTVFASLVVLPC